MRHERDMECNSFAARVRWTCGATLSPLCCVEDARDQYRLARLRLLVQGDNEFHATSSATCYNLPQRSPYPIYAPQFA